MGIPLRLLLVEDSDNDATLLLEELRDGGFAPICERVETAPALIAALDRQPWDLVIADFTMPGFSGTQALEILRARGLDTPFIFVSGTIGEDVAAGAMKTGASDYIIKGNLRRLVPAIERELREAELRREHRRVTARVQQLAYYDVLTGLPNRALLHDRLLQGLAAAQRDRTPLAFVMLDLDGFKDVNDTLGHRVGDALLQQVSQRIQHTLREIDTVARLGGDEFALVLPGADRDTVHLMIERLVAAVEQPFHTDNLKLDVHASIGIALYPDHGDDPHVLMQRADVAMYVAKETRRGVAIYTPDIDRHSQQRLALSSELGLAVRTGQLVFHYQPKVSLSRRRVLGLEVLTYWQHPREGLLPPGRFIGVAEQVGLIRDITLSAIEAALQACCQWRTDEWTPILAVNLSPRTLHDERFPDDVTRLVAASGLPSSCLELEITEGVIIADPLRALAILTRLSGMGIHLSIDDFGTGYSSLSYLTKLPVSEIKIDKSFITDLARNGEETIMRSTIDLAHNLGLTVVAEGVETPTIWDKLTALGCDAAQGYYISPPVPRDEMTEWLKRY